MNCKKKESVDCALARAPHCFHETCTDSHCKGNHTLNGHTPQCVEPYFWCCSCDMRKLKE